jgi:hypothetical protein
MRHWTADGGSWLRQMLDGEKPHPLIKQDVQGASLPNVRRPPARRDVACDGTAACREDPPPRAEGIRP